MREQSTMAHSRSMEIWVCTKGATLAIVNSDVACFRSDANFCHDLNFDEHVACAMDNCNCN